MSKPITTSDIGDTKDLTYMGYIMTLFIRLDLTWAFTPTRDIRASVHSVNSGLPVHGPVDPCSPFVCDEDSRGSSTAAVRAVEVETAAYLRSGCGNDNICWSLRHNSLHVRQKLNLE
uniref:AC5 protein n=1 Tax=Papaya leaf curl virus TaxID=53260 RepID=H6UWZ8_9GEMI|nr:AC5 protein [Papaya leaf curl virus]